MATIALTLGAKALASKAGLSAFAAFALQIGAYAVGSFIDNRIFGPGRQKVRNEGPRESGQSVLTSVEGSTLPKVWGRARVGGQIIWATNFNEIVTEETETVGGGKGGQGGGQEVTTTSYTYTVSFAVALAEGEIDRIGRIWADAKPFDLTDVTFRFYKGTETQNPDSLIQATEGASVVPAFRGVSYIVFENLDLTRFGNRIPQMNFEIFRTPKNLSTDALENVIKAIDLIPGTGEFALNTQRVFVETGEGTSSAINYNNSEADVDFKVAVDQIIDLLPNLERVVLVVSWFGDDLRASNVEFKPKVEVSPKTTYPIDWLVNGVTRSGAEVVSQISGGPAFGGTPTDTGVVEAIKYLKSKGLEVYFYPFILMDIPSGNTLPDPYSDNAATIGQPVYPWRGRITVSPAAGFTGSPDKTSPATMQVNSFFGSANSGDFSVNGEVVSWTGGADWGYRRFILHYALLCDAAGGVDGFLIGTELRGMTWIRNSNSDYPTVDRLVTLAADVSNILDASTKISYAADWSEFFGHQPNDGTNDVYFHLDLLWSDSNIDFIGIDYYQPLSDWRDGSSHTDYDPTAYPDGIYDLDYLQSQIYGGENFDYFYASFSDREAQTRTTITDGAGKPWVFKSKDLKSWWENQHYNRPGGSESGSPTSWVPESKPFYMTEVGVPAVDKGTNQPNVFFDPKSSESFVPYFPNSRPDDLIQRRGIEAFHKFFADATNNPISSVYADKMLPDGFNFVWTFDARPFPYFPVLSDVWSDGDNWRFGHWLNGRAGQWPLNLVVGDLVEEVGLTTSDYDADRLLGLVIGLIRDRVTSPRSMIEPLGSIYFFDAFESQDKLKFAHRYGISQASFTEDDLVIDKENPSSRFNFDRDMETELPQEISLSYMDDIADYRFGAVRSEKLVGESDVVSEQEAPLVLEAGFAQAVVNSMLQETVAMRESISFSLSMKHLALDPTDIITVTLNSREIRLMLTAIADSVVRALSGTTNDGSIYFTNPGDRRKYKLGTTTQPGRAVVNFMDLPLLSGTDVEHQPYVAGYLGIWPGSIAVYKSADDTSYLFNTSLLSPAIMGETSTDFNSGPTGRFDYGNTLDVTLFSNSTLSSRSELEIINGENQAAIKNVDGEWEVIQFQNATLMSGTTWRLSKLRRGTKGTELAMRNPVSSGAEFVILNNSLKQLDLSLSERGTSNYYLYGPGNKPTSDITFQKEQLTFLANGLRPYSPVHLRGEVNGSGDLIITWVRRTRIGGDDFNLNEVPISEDSELYDVEIVGGSTVVRTFTGLTSPTVTYTVAQQSTDSVTLPVTVRVFQLSSVYGRGTKRESSLG